MRKLPPIEIGTRFSKLTVIGHGERVAVGCRNAFRQKSIVKCDCGKEIEVFDCNLRSGRTKSCGSCHKTFVGRNSHGDSRKDSLFNKLFNVWRGIKYRCEHDKNYFGRGICICEEWKYSYSAFKNWSLNNGYREGLSIDRIDNDGNYCPSNCRWTTRIVQTMNRRCSITITAFGETKTIEEWSREKKIPYRTLYGRIKRGIAPEEAMS